MRKQKIKMSNIDLSNQAGVTPVETTATPIQGKALTPYNPPGVPANNSLVLGDKIPDFSEVIFPRLNIVQGVGALKDSFPQGAIVHGQSLVLFEPPVLDAKTGNLIKAGSKPLVLTVLGFRPTRYAEKIAGGARGLIVNTEDEVRQNGGTLDYKEWELKKQAGMKRFEPLADALVAIERPEGIDDTKVVFSFPAAGRDFAVALWGLKGVSYTAAARKVFFTQRRMGCLRVGGYPSYSFAVTTYLEKYPGGHSAWVPVVVPSQKNSPEFLAFAESILTAPTQDTPETE